MKISHWSSCPKPKVSATLGFCEITIWNLWHRLGCQVSVPCLAILLAFPPAWCHLQHSWAVIVSGCSMSVHVLTFYWSEHNLPKNCRGLFFSTAPIVLLDVAPDPPGLLLVSSECIFQHHTRNSRFSGTLDSDHPVSFPFVSVGCCYFLFLTTEMSLIPRRLILTYLFLSILNGLLQTTKSQRVSLHP